MNGGELYLLSETDGAKKHVAEKFLSNLASVYGGLDKVPTEFLPKSNKVSYFSKKKLA